MKKHLFWIASIALGAVACTDKDMAPEDVATPAEPGTEQTVTSNLQTAKLATFKSSKDRVTLNPETRDGDEIKTLELIAEIGNLSQEGKISGFVQETGGRYLSATCVYYDQTTGTFYTTYHMQGNNYNTTQTNETGGFIETFTLDENDKPEVGAVYMAADPSNLSFDFNHLYFDVLDNTYMTYNGKDAGSKRIIAVGHKSEPSSKVGGEPNTAGIIARLNLEDPSNPSIDYEVVYTGEKILDAEGKSLGKEDVSDVNCVLRKSNYYYLATRKGIAVLNAKDDNLFTPIHDYVPSGEYNDNGQEKMKFDEESVYFIKTPGSAKHLDHIYTNSHFSLLYLSEPYDNVTKDTESVANIINFSMETGGGTLCGSNTSDYGTDGPNILNSKNVDITTWSPNVNQTKISQANVSPVDGKNVLALDNNGMLAACLGKGGLYVKYNEFGHNTIKTFSDKKDGTGSRPVNGVFIENYENVNGYRSNDGFFYVANGACLTILDANTLEPIAEYSAFDSKADTNLASANYVHVVKSEKMTNGVTPDRIVTVAYGQEGVKVFRFVPPVK